MQINLPKYFQSEKGQAWEITILHLFPFTWNHIWQTQFAGEVIKMLSWSEERSWIKGNRGVLEMAYTWLWVYSHPRLNLPSWTVNSAHHYIIKSITGPRLTVRQKHGRRLQRHISCFLDFATGKEPHVMDRKVSWGVILIWTTRIEENKQQEFLNSKWKENWIHALLPHELRTEQALILPFPMTLGALTTQGRDSAERFKTQKLEKSKRVSHLWGFPTSQDLWFMPLGGLVMTHSKVSPSSSQLKWITLLSKSNRKREPVPGWEPRRFILR